MSTKKRILFIATEMSPYLELTEFAEIINKLAIKSNDSGLEVRCIMPRFGVINERRHRLHEVVRLSGINVSVDDDDYEIDESLNIIFETENVTYNDGDVTITLISEDLLGIGEIVEIAIYPNPTTGMISLEMIDFYELTIYDLSGKKIMQSYMPSLNINQLKVGTYLLEASDKSGRKVKAKILKK